MLRFSVVFLSLIFSPLTFAAISETVYVESPTDTDSDGRFDRIYVEITRPSGSALRPSIMKISPYAMGGNQVAYHNVDRESLPQGKSTAKDKTLFSSLNSSLKYTKRLALQAVPKGYASLSVHSLGTGRSTGCPTVGDENETLAAKAVIDWLNGRAKAFDRSGRQVKATWSNGNVGMYGVSYNGTLPNMVATTGVSGLKAIVPIAAISDWYDYYRANGLVVGPGGYIGEDADSLAKYIVRSGSCQSEIAQITQQMGRHHGDFSNFWQDRAYVAKADQVTAAVFIIHGQNDWNVRQRHAIRWWEALKGRVPLKMWLHRGGHGNASRPDSQQAIWDWFDRHVKGNHNTIQENVEVQYPDGSWQKQNMWPNEDSEEVRFFMNSSQSLSRSVQADAKATFVDKGKTKRAKDLLKNWNQTNSDRLIFVTKPMSKATLFSGTPSVSLSLAVLNRKAANLSLAIIDYSPNGAGKIVTRGWADPQNHSDIENGDLLTPGLKTRVTFDLEPKQFILASGHRLGLMVFATDFDHTIRPNNGTKIAVDLGSSSWVDFQMKH